MIRFYMGQYRPRACRVGIRNQNALNALLRLGYRGLDIWGDSRRGQPIYLMSKILSQKKSSFARYMAKFVQ